MEKKHIEQIIKIAPEARGKTMLFGHWIGKRYPDLIEKVMKHFCLYIT
jgi:protein-tyrosine phosphatase